MNILKYLSDKERSFLKHVSYQAGESIFRENDECFSIGIVLSGSIRIVSYSRLGKETVFNTVNEN
ncbi:MAG: cyclic nucleotide-binding domain-containing protein, partial [Erysipelotrichaceae bacterium]|nr:cyclic nucleotide-binding domain-containing protein [Erysipelotrichaceae bacterium]